MKTFMSSVVVDRSVAEGGDVNKILSIVVQRMRSVIGRANTLSDNPAEVPPEGLQHCLILAVVHLLNGTPNFGFLLKGPDGSESGLGYYVRQAEKWLDKVERGMAVTYPTNPSTAANVVRYGGEDLVDTTAA